VHRGRFDREAVRQAEQTLAQGRMLVMFPEGHRRGQEGYTPAGYVGAALIAMRAFIQRAQWWKAWFASSVTIVGITLFGAVGYVLINLIVDLLQAWIDPRISLK